MQLQENKHSFVSKRSLESHTFPVRLSQVKLHEGEKKRLVAVSLPTLPIQRKPFLFM